MEDRAKNIIIGVFALAACTIVVMMILFLHPSAGDEGQTLRVRFSDIDKVNVGTRVTFAGRAVGEVSEIIQLTDGREGKADANGHLYAYELILKVDSHLKVYNTDQIFLRTSGLLGERSVAISPIVPPKHEQPRLVTKDEILYATPTTSVEEAMAEFKDVADILEGLLTNANTTLDEFRKEEVIKKISQSMQNVSEITTALNQPDELTNIITNMQEFTAQLNNRVGPSWDTLDLALENFEQGSKNIKLFSTNLSNVFVDIQGGKGSFGKILVDEDLYIQLKSVLGKVDTVANDVNHYGLLFHLDKGWQRLRARRLNLMQKLATPQEFRNYFNDEVDQISTSLSRVSMVLEQIDGCCLPSPLENKDFVKVFAELLRRMETLEESIKLYNQQITEPEVQKTELTTECCCQ